MHVSLNEAGAVAKRAARGAGYAWGLADEAGFAARWLAQRQLPFAAALAGHFARVDGAGLAEFRPRGLGRDWQPRGVCLCPLIAGAALMDLAGGLTGGITLHAVSHPLLLLPFAARASFTLRWAEDGGGLAVPQAAEVVLSAGSEIPPAVLAHAGAEVEPGCWQRLLDLGARTFVPSTDHSRRAGAGAGLVDAD